ncbi:hypothetical protein JCM10908_003017 [Rhodotorula pacifica]|uniref:uncharacterized protein n=1 Tax=Rhodotorula pacifica TaxID=1495444 RepID=UPI00317D1FC3
MADALKQAGNKFFAAKQYSKAIKKYTDALAKDPSDEDAAIILANRSASYTLLNKYDLAVADAEHAAERRPRWPKAQVRLAEALSRKHAFFQAESAWKLAIEYSENEDDRKRYTVLMEQASQAAEKSREKNKPDRPNYGKLDSAADTWYAKLERAQREGRPPPTPLPVGLAISCLAWHNCESSWTEIDKGVQILPNKQAKTELFHPHTLSGLVDTILTDHAAFHITWMPKDGQPLLEKLTHLLQAESTYGDFAKYINGKWNGAKIIDDLDKQIAEKGRDRVRRMTASVIYGRIIAAFLTTTSSNYGISTETYRLAIEILEAGNRKWAHEDLDVRGHVFSRTVIRNTRLQILRCLIAGRMGAKTPAAKRAFPLSDIEKAAKAVLDDKIPESYWAESADDPTFRLSFDDLPRWEATAAIGLVHNKRATEPFEDMPRGKVVFADVEEARKAAKYYDSAASMMPDDFHDKSTMMWIALYNHLRAGGLRVAAIRDRVAAAERVDAILEPYFGLDSHQTEQYKFCKTQCDALAQIPPSVSVKPIPTFRNLPGRDPRDFISEKIWQGLAGDAGVVDIVGLPANLQ